MKGHGKLFYGRYQFSVGFREALSLVGRSRVQSQEGDHPARALLARVRTVASSKRIVTEVAIGTALCRATEFSPPWFEDLPLYLGGIIMHAVLCHVRLLMVNAPMIVGTRKQTVSARVVGINLASGLHVPNRRTDKRPLAHVRLQFKPTPRSILLYPKHRRGPVSSPTP